MAGIDIHRLLQTAVDQNATDVHITAGIPPALRIDGKLFRLKSEPLTPNETQEFAYSIMTEKQKKTFEACNEVDLSFKWKDKSRFRANFFRQKGAVAAALRKIPTDVLPLEKLGFPSAIYDIIAKPNGLFLVTGPTGSGKSTTLASVVNELNVRHRGHILTIEDPIEFIHEHKNCIVNQREVGADTESFANALRYSLRQDPDFVLVGEIRDRETMEIGLRIAETGHFTLATLHTNSAIQTIHRILDFFPPDQQEMVRTQISFVLQGVITQQLLKKADGKGRVLCAEILIPNHAIRHLIRDDKTQLIYSQMQMGQSASGMCTMNQSLVRLTNAGLITKEQAINASADTEELNKMFGD
jgi:twitching motility protein PilT